MFEHRVHVLPSRQDGERFVEFLTAEGATLFSVDPDTDEGVAVLWTDAPGNPVDVSDYPSYVATFDRSPGLRMPRRPMVIR